MKYKKIIIIISIILWCTVIFLASNKTSSESNSTSKKVISITLTATVNLTNTLKLTTIDPNGNWLEKTVNKLNYPVRKLAHATIYFILGILVFLLLHSFGIKNRKTFFITILVCFLYSLTDEYHQTFITNRTGQFSDCLIDTLGAFTSTSILYIFYKLRQRRASIK